MSLNKAQFKIINYTIFFKFIQVIIQSKLHQMLKLIFPLINLISLKH